MIEKLASGLAGRKSTANNDKVPGLARYTAVAADAVDFPTPPLPPNIMMRVNMGITKGVLARIRIPAVLDDFWLGSWNLVSEKNVSNPGCPRGESRPRGFDQTMFLTIAYI